MDEERRLCGLNYARQLNFTEAQYEEALKRIDSPDNANQLLAALIDISTQACDSPASLSIRSNKTGHLPAGAEIDQVQTSVGRPSPVANSTTAGPINLNSTPTPSAPVSARTTTTSRFECAQTNDSISSLSSTTSCYSSITSFPSSSDQSLESLTNSFNNNTNHPHQLQRLNPQSLFGQSVASSLRKIYIDGSNVARTHGKNRIFSWLGIKLCVDWFLNRRHDTVKVFVPEDRCQRADDEILINYLEKVDALIKTPSGCNDDFFIIEAARQNNGIIVSNDLYRDEKRLNNELENFINDNRLPYIFVEDLFIPAEGPRGRFGPSLDVFLREKQPLNSIHSKLSRTKSHQRYQRNGTSYRPTSQCFVSPNLISSGGHASEHSHRALQSTKSLPLEQSSYECILQSTDCSRYTSEPIRNDHPYQSRMTQQPMSDDSNDMMQQSRQLVRKSKSIACANNVPNITKELQNQKEDQLQYGKKSALMRTKSHNI